VKNIFVIILVCLPVFCYAQRAKIIGGVPPFDSTKLYRIQVGAYINAVSAENAFNSLQKAGLNPSYEDSIHYRRVVLAGLSLRHIPLILYLLYQAGFDEVIIREEGDDILSSILAVDALENK
jgi:hypothetical protein